MSITKWFDCWRTDGSPADVVHVAADDAEEAARQYAEHVNDDASYGVVSPHEGDAIDVAVRNGFSQVERFRVETVCRFRATQLPVQAGDEPPLGFARQSTSAPASREAT